MSYTVGQRWVSQSEPKLGLGIISEYANRRIAINFPAAGENRIYAIDNAPISRVVYKEGDEIFDHDDTKFLVKDLHEANGLILYDVETESGESKVLSEVELNCFIQFTSPLQRLISGHYDRNKAFKQRYATLRNLHRLQQSEVQGLLGSRTSLLPHQVYIADQVAKRHAPRVLLADEVGLGKTIEAGMILHAQLHKGLAERVLILVPNALVHQWLVEMLRRFNLAFSIFDKDRYDSLIEEGLENPFDSEQLVLCDIKLLSENEEAKTKALATNWDLLIVDEAHHLQWSETESSPDYQVVEALSALSQGVLLLTATPEQAGLTSHFARLRLLDPDRFHSLSEFAAEQEHYGEISDVVKSLQAIEDDATVPAELQTTLNEQFHCGDLDYATPAAELVPQIIQRLIDQHGTGRVLFRNTRQAVKGFPERLLHAYPLETEESHSDDVLNDARLGWLVEKLKELKPAKVLVICASKETAISLETNLRLVEGFATASFHENMSIIERDRAAAYFADKEEGAQALICSEIGSEGRNFQFAHHLVLFDLPENPDLLEQRIGRLDRIGQLMDINIHVPYLIGSRQEGLFHWYNEGLNAFTQSCAAGYALFEKHQTALEQHLSESSMLSDAGQSFLSAARADRDAAMEALQSGRDPLLELNSCNTEVANTLIEALEVEESAQSIGGYMENMFELYGVEQEHQTDSTVVIHPGQHMLTHDFPGLSSEGKTITYHRLKALSREDVDFITWEHPMVVELMDQTLSSELGNAGIVTISVKGVKPGTLFLECIFTLNCMAPKHLQLGRFLPISPMRVIVDATGRNLNKVLTHDKVNEICSGLKRNMAHAVIKEVRDEIGGMFNHAKAMVEGQVPKLLDQAKTKLTEHLDHEITRMEALKEHNPLIRDEEIEHLKNQKVECLRYIDKTGLDVQGLRLVISS